MTAAESMEACVTRLVVEYAASVPDERPLSPLLTLRGDLAIESLSLVSLAIRLGDEIGVDVVDAGIDLGPVKTLGDLVEVGNKLTALRA